MSLRIDTTNFKKQAAKLQDLRRWPNAEKFWATQARGVMKETVNRTPPAKGGARGIEAKRKGEGAVERDIGHLFIPVKKAYAEITTQGAVESIHNRARNGRGRVPKALSEKHRVFAPVLNKHRREKKKRVGSLAGGWNRASAKVGYKPPAWVWRHKSPGDVSLKISSRGIKFKATNRVKFASSVSNMEARVQAGIDAQTKKIARQAAFLAGKAAKKAGFKSR